MRLFPHEIYYGGCVERSYAGGAVYLDSITFTKLNLIITAPTSLRLPVMNAVLPNGMGPYAGLHLFIERSAESTDSVLIATNQGSTIYTLSGLTPRVWLFLVDDTTISGAWIRMVQ
jgi:hypothetical protein